MKEKRIFAFLIGLLLIVSLSFTIQLFQRKTAVGVPGTPDASARVGAVLREVEKKPLKFMLPTPQAWLPDSFSSPCKDAGLYFTSLPAKCLSENGLVIAEPRPVPLIMVPTLEPTLIYPGR